MFTTYFTIHLQIAKARFLTRFIPECVKRFERDHQADITERVNCYVSSENEARNLISWRHLKDAGTKTRSGQRLRIEQARSEHLPQKVK